MGFASGGLKCFTKHSCIKKTFVLLSSFCAFKPARTQSPETLYAMRCETLKRLRLKKYPINYFEINLIRLNLSKQKMSNGNFWRNY